MAVCCLSGMFRVIRHGGILLSYIGHGCALFSLVRHDGVLLSVARSVA